jgi:hypothetical protein
LAGIGQLRSCTVSGFKWRADGRGEDQAVIQPQRPSAKDPGLENAVWALLPVLACNRLISGGYKMITQARQELEYVITAYGEHMLARLAEPPPGSLGLTWLRGKDPSLTVSHRNSSLRQAITNGSSSP